MHDNGNGDTAITKVSTKASISLCSLFSKVKLQYLRQKLAGRSTLQALETCSALEGKARLTRRLTLAAVTGSHVFGYLCSAAQVLASRFPRMKALPDMWQYESRGDPPFRTEVSKALVPTVACCQRQLVATKVFSQSELSKDPTGLDRTNFE